MLDTENTLHIRCGSDIKKGLEEAGFVGHFLEFSDPLCLGPLTGGDGGQFLKARADFIESAFGVKADQAFRQLEGQYKALAELEGYDEIILWFEHDTYDQLILAKILSVLSERKVPPVQLILINDFDIEPRFIGLGQLAPDDLKAIWRNRERVRKSQFDYGMRVWKAITQPNPESLEMLIAEDDGAIPDMQNALKRHLQQLPDKKRGLSLTEELCLRALDDEQATAGGIFRRLTLKDEPLPYLGDMMFWYEFQPLILGGLVEEILAAKEWPAKRYRISEKGRQLLKEGAVAAGWEIPAERWVGGIRLAPDVADIYYRRNE